MNVAIKQASAQTRLNAARKKLAALRPHPELIAGRKVVKVDDKMDVEKMAISTFLGWIRDIEPILVQRNDLNRLNRGQAKHLAKLALPQNHFAVVFLNGVFYLVDGNTRKRSWLSNVLRDIPSTVWVTVMVVDSVEEGEATYRCYDSKVAKKKDRDDILSLARRAGKDITQWQSPLLAGGKIVSLARNMARHLFGVNNEANRFEVMKAHLPAFDLLDRHQLDEGHIPAGAVWAALRLYTLVPAQYHLHVQAYIEAIRKFGTPTEQLIPSSIRRLPAKAAEECALRGVGTSGEKPIPVMFPVYLNGFFTYAQELGATHLKTDKAFKTYVTKALRQAVADDIEAAARLLPQVATV
ncbi:hypothetical protein [Burkholderia cenocepacia]|uniref:hypothetical protein n=1 Tax=Burkholderia cenocepacia TaxID=95486 RepID=UPI000761AACC|nr:hypothetical protein [Burkholderia cenocepacia]KWU23417.1 hypothetical protein AS149_37140 [Burkholderia cenocepacia]